MKETTWADCNGSGVCVVAEIHVEYSSLLLNCAAFICLSIYLFVLHTFVLVGFLFLCCNRSGRRCEPLLRLFRTVDSTNITLQHRFARTPRRAAMK